MSLYCVYASVTICQQLLTGNLDEKLNSSKCNLSLEPKIMTVHSRITAFYVSLLTKGHLESPSVRVLSLRSSVIHGFVTEP